MDALLTRYFAYGSNMSLKQMRSRLGREINGEKALLSGFDVVFGKPSHDASWGKINLLKFPGKQVSGIVYQVTEEELAALFTFESGYNRIPVKVTTEDGTEIKAVTFISKHHEPYPPLVEYLETILAGAREQALPTDYIDHLNDQAVLH
jgi:cation transport regulator ChaC